MVLVFLVVLKIVYLLSMYRVSQEPPPPSQLDFRGHLFKQELRL